MTAPSEHVRAVKDKTRFSHAPVHSKSCAQALGHSLSRLLAVATMPSRSSPSPSSLLPPCRPSPCNSSPRRPPSSPSAHTHAQALGHSLRRHRAFLASLYASARCPVASKDAKSAASWTLKANNRTRSLSLSLLLVALEGEAEMADSSTSRKMEIWEDDNGAVIDLAGLGRLLLECSGLRALVANL